MLNIQIQYAMLAIKLKNKKHLYKNYQIKIMLTLVMDQYTLIVHNFKRMAIVIQNLETGHKIKQINNYQKKVKVNYLYNKTKIM